MDQEVEINQGRIHELRNVVTALKQLPEFSHSREARRDYFERGERNRKILDCCVGCMALGGLACCGYLAVTGRLPNYGVGVVVIGTAVAALSVARGVGAQNQDLLVLERAGHQMRRDLTYDFTRDFRIDKLETI